MKIMSSVTSALILFSSSVSAMTITLDTAADNAGIIQSNTTSNQGNRGDSLYGFDREARRNGLIRFESLSAADQTAISNGSLTVTSAKIQFTETNSSHDLDVTLEFYRLIPAFNETASNWNDPDTTDALVEWATAGADNPNDGMDSSNDVFGSRLFDAASSGQDGRIIDVPLTSTDSFVNFLTASTGPQILVRSTSVGIDANGQNGQVRLGTDDRAGDVDAKLILEVIPEPATLSLAGISLLGMVGLRRRPQC